MSAAMLVRQNKVGINGRRNPTVAKENTKLRWRLSAKENKMAPIRKIGAEPLATAAAAVCKENGYSNAERGRDLV